MDLVSQTCARCGLDFDRPRDAKGAQRSWCPACRRAYNRQYKIDNGLLNGATTGCASCGNDCYGVRCRACWNVLRSADKKPTHRTPPRPLRDPATMTPRQIRTDRRYLAVAREVIAEESRCGLCGEIVDKSLPRTARFSATADHIVPLIFGGAPFDRRNLRLAHRSCNAGRRGCGATPLERIAFARAALWLAEHLAA